MFAFAHSDIESYLLLAMGNVVVLLTLAFLALVAMNSVSVEHKQGEGEAAFFALIALFCVLLSFFSVWFLPAVVIATLLVITFGLVVAMTGVVPRNVLVVHRRALHAVR